ncbi:P-loop containing nucleoside triphosphate hydrolase protein [Thelephora ganbajun]|uniref:P-loop containing nucleoside triphosphate hydrolase protein n=1 Tax=Thelephora ganbajun TaxID=370292 RepID=A0ACB6ZVS3_THEGA|nr:P-loop containing nucleoside triphosphate hydrolase protein [Thelephora ganbajun]
MLPRLTSSSSRSYSSSPPPPRKSASSSKHRKAPGPPIMIAVMGATGSGKTSFINLASRSNLRIGMNLNSCTAEVQLADEFSLDGRRVILIDTPGFDDTSKSDTDILKMIAAFLATTYEKGSKLAGVIYVHRISDKRFTGIAGRNFKMFRELCGDTTLKNVVLVTNMWGEVSRKVGESREDELSGNFFKPVLDKGAQMVRHHNTAQSAHDIIRMIMKNRPVVLQIQRELVDEHKDIIDTAAGEAVNRELNEQIRRHQAELKIVQEEMMQALKEKDEETRQELEEETRKLQEQMEKIKKDSEGMASNYAVEKERMEVKMKEMEQEARKERQRAEAEYNRQMADLNKRLQEVANASKAERERLERDIKRLQDRLDDSDDDSWCILM